MYIIYNMYYNSDYSKIMNETWYTKCIGCTRIAGKFDDQNIWRFAPPKVLGGFKFGDG